MRAVQTTLVAVLLVEGTSMLTTLRLVGSVSIVAPAVLTSEKSPEPLALKALTFTLMRLSLGRAVRVLRVDIGTLHFLALTTVASVPSQRVSS